MDENNPDAAYTKALESLSISTGNEPPAEEEALIQQSPHPIGSQLKQASSKMPLLVTAAIALAVTGVALLYLHNTASVPEIAADYTEQKISEVIVNPPPATLPTSDKREARKPKEHPTAQDDATARVNALAEKLRKRGGSKHQARKRSARQNEKSESRHKETYRKTVVASSRQINMNSSERSNPATKLSSEALCAASERLTQRRPFTSIFRSHDPKQTNALAHQRDYRGDYDVEEFKKLIGKSVTIDGVIFIESLHKSHYVKITSMEQITLGE